MAIKRMAIIFAASFMCIGISAAAEDAVIYENPQAETSVEYTDLPGWGRELYTKASFEADVQFKEAGAGITLRSADNTKDGTSIRAVDRDGKLTLCAYSDASNIYYIEVDPTKTYHISVIGTYGVSDGIVDMTVDTYAEDGSVELSKNYSLILMNKMFASSNVGPEHIRIEANTVAKNIKVTEFKPDSIKLTLPESIITGSSLKITAKPQRNGEDFNYPLDIKYTISQSDALLSEENELFIPLDAKEGNITVTAECEDMKDTADISIITKNVFVIKSAVFSEDGKTLEAINAYKNYFYEGTAAFVVTVYDGEGTLRDVFVKSVPVKAIASKKESEIVLGYSLPTEFDKDTWSIEVNAWSEGEICDMIEAGESDIPLRTVLENNGGGVEWIGEHSVVAAMLNSKVVVLQIGSSSVFADNSSKEISKPTYIKADMTYVPTDFIKIFFN